MVSTLKVMEGFPGQCILAFNGDYFITCLSSMESRVGLLKKSRLDIIPRLVSLTFFHY